MYQVLLYYCYSPIANPDAFRDEQHRLCLALDLRGRIIVAAEGRTGTGSGTRESCAAYMAAVHADSRFVALEFKIDEVDGHTFQKLHVRVKPEIVHSSLRHVRPTKKPASTSRPPSSRP